MKDLTGFIKNLPDTAHASEYCVYEKSVNKAGDMWVFMIREDDDDYIVAVGCGSDAFEGEKFECAGLPCVKAPKTFANGNVLRKLFSWTAPAPVLREKRSFGCGDRLGIAGPGHIRVFEKYDAYPIFAQQSIRELNLTNRTYEDVLDCATFSVFREGYKDGFGADGDHLKQPEDVKYALSLNFTMITLDCSDHIRNDVDAMSDDEVNAAVELTDDEKATYLDKTYDIEGIEIKYTEIELKRNILIYKKAVDFAVMIYNTCLDGGKANCDFEISIDETATPTTPLQHFYVANELTKQNVKFATMAPRFCGEFQKGVDYIGNLAQFEEELKVHAAIARHFGYKLSIHSGSDKFSTFTLIGKYTNGNFHVKTAGTNWLEAMRAVAASDPALYRSIHKYALTMFDEAKKFYHVTTDLNKIPDVDTLKDEELVDLFTQNDARQLIHITYGFILNVKDDDGNYLYKDKLFKMWRDNEEVYANMLDAHIGKHLELLYAGFEK